MTQQYLTFESHPTIGYNFEFQESTMQVPCGPHSIFYSLREKEVTPAETITYLALNYASHWNSGKTRKVNQHALASELGMSQPYIFKNLKSLLEKGWIEHLLSDAFKPISDQYKLKHHLCAKENTPLDKDGKPLKMAVPYGPGGPFERLHAEDISWKACLVWTLLKHESNWQTGKTKPCTLLQLSKICGFSTKTLKPIIEELQGAEMLARLSTPREKAIFQLYPRPKPKPKPGTPGAYPREHDNREKYYYSSGGKYRCCRVTAELYVRVGYERWRKVLDRERPTIPPAVQAEFDKWIRENNPLRQHTAAKPEPNPKKGGPRPKPSKQKPSKKVSESRSITEILDHEGYWWTKAGKYRCSQTTHEIEFHTYQGDWVALEEDAVLPKAVEAAFQAHINAEKEVDAVQAHINAGKESAIVDNLTETVDNETFENSTNDTLSNLPFS